MEKTISCKACGKEKRKSDKFCPHCGTKKPFREKKRFYVLIIVAILTVILSINNIKVDATVVTKNGTTYSCNGFEYRDMFDQYSNNKENPFHGASVSVTDKIRSISRIGSGQYVVLKSGWAFYSDENIKVADSFKKGSRVRIEGTVGYQNFSNSSWTSISINKYTAL